MQKIEKWRIQEMALVLHRLSDLLRLGDNSEWANVMSHYYQEAQSILLKDELDSELLNRLVLSIGNCFQGNSSFKNLSLVHEDDKRRITINNEFLDTRDRLLQIIRDIEKRSIEYTH